MKRTSVKPKKLVTLLVALLFVLCIQDSASEFSKNMTPEDAVQVLIEKYIQKEFRQPEYKLMNQSEIQKSRLSTPFGAKNIQHYTTNWSSEDAYFRVYVGYSKASGEFVGGEIRIYVKNPELKGKKLAEAYLLFIPNKEWKHAGPKIIERYSGEKFSSEISSVISRDNKIKTYIEVISIECLNPKKCCYATNVLQSNYSEIGMIVVDVYMEGNPFYSDVESIQRGNLLVWGNPEFGGSG